ncbi:MAG: CBS domain-containing protein [Coriobacteriia bacterium]|nr:CBS domain-containing protein [Coriobacteriia bacterium]
MSNAQTFIAAYKKLEAAVRESYGLENGDSVSHFLCTQQRFKKHVDSIRCAQNVRNLLQHDAMVGGAPAVEPSGQLVSFVTELTNVVLSRPRVADVCVKRADVFAATLQTPVREVVSVMHERGFSTVPVLDGNDVVQGVFTEGFLFDYLARRGSLDLSQDLLVSDVAEDLALDGREGERVLFVKRTMLVDDLIDRAESAFRKADRLSVALVTSTGKATEPLQGLVTPWDLLSVL